MPEAAVTELERARLLLDGYLAESGALDKPPSYVADVAQLVCALALIDIAESLRTLKEALA